MLGQRDVDAGKRRVMEDASWIMVGAHAASVSMEKHGSKRWS